MIRTSSVATQSNRRATIGSGTFTAIIGRAAGAPADRTVSGVPGNQHSLPPGPLGAQLRRLAPYLSGQRPAMFGVSVLGTSSAAVAAFEPLALKRLRAMAAFTELMLQLLPSLVYLCVSVVVMLGIDLRLSLAVLVFAPLPAVVGALASKEQTRREQGLMQAPESSRARLILKTAQGPAGYPMYPSVPVHAERRPGGSRVCRTVQPPGAA